MARHLLTHPTSAPRSTPIDPLAQGTQPRIAVIGGSLTGCTTALPLLDAGFHKVAIYEAAPDAAPREGGLIGLEHPALDVLDRLGIDQREFVAYDSETVWQVTVRARQHIHTTRQAYPGRNTTWTLLHHALTSRLPDGVLHTGRRLTDLGTRHGQPLLAFHDGSREVADLVVFADGRASTGRRLLDPSRRLRYAGYVAHRGHAPTPEAALRDFLRLEPGLGCQYNVAPVPGGLDWTFYLTCTPVDYTRHFGAPPERRLFALPQHVSAAARAHVDAHATRLLPAPHAATVHATAVRMAVPVMDIDPPTRMAWPVGSGWAVLLGDALAPVRPHTARGANNGIEQAAGLTAALTQHRRFGADLQAALRGWQHRHLPTAVAAVHQGPAIGARLGLGAPARSPQPRSSST
ncbi:monooxygenase [Micromonospora endolithica]|uniref:Monooxygenase n=1 Tax=Micromonospora endolithica TaxID=230091 RepID=A0A3A9ZFM8_9ACTN|nr:monooxygenase [Micromonospora endolithica]RKN46167.1 monooxygenase [Micromonospora endolithica]TWJ25126.1 2-polyprenyl-6-methoxyphenol hydroxylase-like FAD-dependent oxidoreductase [Micromonospora endolithica]